MSRAGFGITTLAAAVTATALTVSMLAAGAPAVAGQASAGGPPATAGSGPPAAQRVMLVTGDVVTVSARPGGPQEVSVLRARTAGPGALFQTFTTGGDLYVVPESAVPYLGSALSPALFDVTQLARQERGRMSLAVTLRLRHPAGSAARSGRLTEATARAFGAALVSHPAALFAKVASVAPAAQSSAGHTGVTRANDRVTKYTLTLKGINAAGKKDSGDMVLIYDVSDLKDYDSYATFKDGVATAKVPAGDYEALCFFYDQATQGADEVMDPQFKVSGSTSVTLDARQATSPVSVTTPKNTTAQLNTVGFGRRDATGRIAPFSFIGNGQTVFKVQPLTSGITIGKLYYYVYWRSFSPAGTRPAYSYDVEYPSTDTVPANEHYVVKSSSLASVATAYPADRSKTTALDARFPALSWQNSVITSDVEFTTPAQRTEYYTAAGITWAGTYYAVFNTKQDTIQGELDSSWTTYQAGQTSSTTWGGEPEHPRLLQTVIYYHHIYCPACLSGDTLDLLVFPFGDNTPDHRAYPDGAATGLTESEAFDVYADGTKVASGTGFLQDAVTLPSGTKTVRVNYDTVRSSSSFTLSTSADTEWAEPVSTAVKLPAQWYCNPQNQTNCTVLPLLSADYDLPVNLLGQLSPGAVKASADVSHLAGADIAVKSVSLSVSFNGGKSWVKAAVTSKGGGDYAISFTVPAVAKTDGFGAVKLSATDADGGTLTQTIQHAFAVVSS